jgi:hypothetical protein
MIDTWKVAVEEMPTREIVVLLESLNVEKGPGFIPLKCPFGC